MMKYSLTILIMFFLITASNADAWQGRVVRVLDGDTIEVMSAKDKPVRVRLYGIDTPEKSQAFGQKAKAFTLSMVRRVLAR